MENAVWIVLTFLAALTGSLAAGRLRIPAGAMVGSIVFVAAFNLMTEQAAVPSLTRPLMQVLGGALLGHTICKADLKKLRGIMRAAGILILCLITINLFLGYLISVLCGMDIATALFATAPGGVSDMALIADEMGADVGVVSIMQLFRMFGIYFFFPLLFKHLSGRQKGKDNEILNRAAGKPVQPDENKAGRNDYKQKRILFTLGIGAAGGLLLAWAGVPAGYMVGSVLFCGVYNIVTEQGYIPKRWRFWIQSGVGAVIGVQMTRDTLGVFTKLLLPIALMIAGLLVFTLLFASVMKKVSGMDFQTCLLSLTPGGIQETSILADDMGCDTATVVVMHTIRLIVVICIFPSLLALLIPG